MQMIKKIKLLLIMFFGIFLFTGLILVSAHGENTFAEAEEIIMQKISCDDLTESQFEILGDYYMEQMHPGELHEIMDERMGGEGSESLRQVHLNMGRSFYCGEHGTINASMMNVMMGRGMMAYGMMGNSSYRNYPLFILLFTLLLFIGIILFIIWLIKELNKPNIKSKKIKGGSSKK